MAVHKLEHDKFNPALRSLLKSQMKEAVDTGIYDSYKRLIELMVISSVLDNDDETEIVRFAPAARLEQPLMPRFARHPDDGVFLITIGRVAFDSLEDVPNSRLNIGTLRSASPRYTDIAETFDTSQIDTVRKHALEIADIDGVILTSKQ